MQPKTNTDKVLCYGFVGKVFCRDCSSENTHLDHVTCSSEYIHFMTYNKHVVFASSVCIYCQTLSNDLQILITFAIPE